MYDVCAFGVDIRMNHKMYIYRYEDVICDTTVHVIMPFPIEKV